MIKTGARSAPYTLLFGSLFSLLTTLAHAAPDPEKLYATYCLSCHAPSRLGGMGPALLPDSLARLKRPDAIKAIADGLPARPVFTADPGNITLVVEHGDHHITVLDGDKMQPIIRFALHGGPKFTQDGRFVFWATSDGWITKFDLWNLKVVAEIRAGINTRNLAVSSDGKVVF